MDQLYTSYIGGGSNFCLGGGGLMLMIAREACAINLGPHPLD